MLYGRGNNTAGKIFDEPVGHLRRGAWSMLFDVLIILSIYNKQKWIFSINKTSLSNR